jgi:hypothetical protein
MRLVEQHSIDQHDPRWRAIDAAAFAAKNLYNAALYVTRQAFIHQHQAVSYEELARDLKTTEAYRALPRLARSLNGCCGGWRSPGRAISRSAPPGGRIFALPRPPPPAPLPGQAGAQPARSTPPASGWVCHRYLGRRLGVCRRHSGRVAGSEYWSPSSFRRCRGGCARTARRGGIGRGRRARQGRG